MSRHDKDYNSSVKLSAYADLMLDRIDTCISDKISKSVTRLASAIVTKVNSDGSVNIRLPSEDNTEFTKIQNQCPYELKVGDAVELTLKNGSFNNCWVSAKHGMGIRATSEGSSGSYVLPVATATQLGGIKVGAGLVIKNGILSVTGGGTADAVEWENVLNAPTTLAGYGITDARINSGTITLGGNSIVPLTASSNLDATKLVGNVPNATKAIQDGNGDVIVDTYAKKTDIPSLSGYATQTWVENKGYLTEHQSLAGYATETWVQQQGYLTTHQDISGLATKIELQTVENKIPTVPTKISAFDNDAKYITASGAPVQSVNGKTGTVSLTANDIGALPSTTTIPVVNNAKLTIQKNGVEVDSFTANASVDKTINIEVPTKASDINAISTDDISQTLGNSETKVPSEKAVTQAMTAAGYGDMLKANYASKSDSIVDKSYADENGNNIVSTYIPKFKLLNNIDANSLTTSQICVIGAGNTNLPDEATGSVLFVAGDGTNAFQIIVVYATNVLSHRAYKDGAWTIWRSTEATHSSDSSFDVSAFGLGFVTGE